MADRISFFNQSAATWDTHPRPDEAKLQYIISFLADTPRQQVIDAGCGTGILLPFLQAKLGTTAQIFAVDFAAEMLQQAKAKFNLPNIEFIQGDVTRLGFPAKTIDAIICYSLYPHLDDKNQAMAEFARMLRPSGRLVIAHTKGRNAINQIHQNLGGPVLHDLLPALDDTITVCENSGLVVVESRDDDDYYLVVAEKPSRE